MLLRPSTSTPTLSIYVIPIPVSLLFLVRIFMYTAREILRDFIMSSWTRFYGRQFPIIIDSFFIAIEEVGLDSGRDFDGFFYFS